MTLPETLVRNAELEAALALRDSALAEQDKLVGELRASLAQALERIRSLEERLKQNSQNSSRPPSSDGPGVKRPPASRGTGRKQGAQEGHKGRGRALVDIEQVSEVIDCVPETCGHCGGALEGEDPAPQRHQVAEIPEPAHVVTEYRQHRRRCGRCGKVTIGELPAGVTGSGSRFVERIMTVASSLKAQQRDSFAFLVDALFAHAAGTSAPSLLPVADLPT